MSIAKDTSLHMHRVLIKIGDNYEKHPHLRLRYLIPESFDICNVHERILSKLKSIENTIIHGISLYISGQ